MERYIIGNKNDVKAVFANKDYEHARTSLDGDLVVIEAEVDDEIDALLTESGIQVLDHEQAIKYLNAPESEDIWYVKPPPECIDQPAPQEGEE